MSNFNGYFSKENPKYLADKFSQESRKANKKLRQKAGLEYINEQNNEIDEIVETYQLQNLGRFCEELQSNE